MTISATRFTNPAVSGKIKSLRGWAALVLLCGCVAPAVAQERSWTLDGNDTDVFLTFGVPATDDIGISFWCKVKSDKISIFVPNSYVDLPVNAKAKLELAAGDMTLALDGVIGAPMSDGAKTIEAEIKTDSKLLSALETADFLTVTSGKHVTKFPLIDVEFGELVKYCKGG